MHMTRCPICGLHTKRDREEKRHAGSATCFVQKNSNKKSPELGQSCTAFLDTMNLCHWPAPE
jgi:hypothetical protein